MKKTVSVLLAALLAALAFPALAAQTTLNYGGNEISCLVLTDFNDGEVVGAASGGGTMQIEDGILIMSANSGGYVESYSFYSGGNINAPEVADAVWIGFSIQNPSDADIQFAFQGQRQGGLNFRMSAQGENMLLAANNGQVAQAKAVVSNNRIAAVIPAGFEGALLLPTSRVSSSMNNPPDWNSGGNKPFYRLGFYIKDNGSTGRGVIKLSNMFMLDEALPGVDFVEEFNNITNPEYSYTDAQRIQAFWTENVMYNETVCMLKEGDSISARTLFTPTRIISVVNNALNKEYKEGVDYQWVEGTNQIKWLEGSSIPYFYNGALSGLKENGTPVNDYPNWDSEARCRLAGVLYCAEKFLWEKQIAVTYEYDQSQVEANGIVYTQQQSDRLPNTTQKLANNESLKVLFYGDSIFAGGDASSGRGREPMMPTMDVLMAEYLRTISSGTITFDNISVGGWTVENGLAALQPGGYAGKDYSQYSGYDLLMLSFGMNNAGTSAESFKATTQEIVETIKEKNPNIEVILVSCICPNPAAAGFYGNQQYFGAALQELADENGYAFVDMFAVHKKILEFKNYSATTGNGINHPNDWLIRIYAQNILSAMVEFE